MKLAKSLLLIQRFRLFHTGNIWQRRCNHHWPFWPRYQLLVVIPRRFSSNSKIWPIRYHLFHQNKQGHLAFLTKLHLIVYRPFYLLPHQWVDISLHDRYTGPTMGVLGSRCQTFRSNQTAHTRFWRHCWTWDSTEEINAGAVILDLDGQGGNFNGCTG